MQFVFEAFGLRVFCLVVEPRPPFISDQHMVVEVDLGAGAKDLATIEVAHRHGMPRAVNTGQPLGQSEGEFGSGIAVLVNRQSNVVTEETIHCRIQCLPAIHHLVGFEVDLLQVLVLALPVFTAQTQVVVEVTAEMVMRLAEGFIFAALLDQIPKVFFQGRRACLIRLARTESALWACGNRSSMLTH